MEQIEVVALLMGAVAMVSAAFTKMKWNPVLGLIAAGVALGPNGFKLVAPGGALSVMAELGVLFLLFTIGVELSADRIRSMARYVFGLGAAHFALCGLLLAAFAWAIGETPVGAVVIGVALAMSSTAFVVQTLSSTGQMAGGAGRKSFSVLLFQDIMVAPILALLPLLVSMGAPHADTAGKHGHINMVVATIAMMMTFVVGRLILQQLIDYIHEQETANSSKKGHKESGYFFSAVISVALLMGVVAHHLGLSASLGAFLAGLALSGGKWRHDVKDVVGHVEAPLLGIFFISLGAQVPLSATPVEMLLMAAAAVAIIAIKVGAGFLAALANGLDKRRGFRVGLILAQAGEFSFIVLASVGAAALPEASAKFWSGAAVLSLVATPLLVTLAGKLRTRPVATVADPAETATVVALPEAHAAESAPASQAAA